MKVKPIPSEPVKTAATRCAAAVIALLCGNLFLGSVHSAPGQDPLAKCELQVIAAQPAAGMAYVPGALLMQPAAENAPIYRKGPAGDWLVPEKVNPQDPTIRGLLLTPQGVILMQVDVQIGGRPFRAPFERWIDAALDAGKKPPPSAGAAESPAPKAGETTATEPPAEAFRATSPSDWLGEYVKNATAPVDRFEARWLLAQRAGGPALMELERFSTGRSMAAPLVHFLDADGDGTLSASEIQQATARLSAADTNQDSGIELAELERARPRQPSAYRIWRAEPLFVVLDDQTDWQAVEQVVQSRYPNPAAGATGSDVASLKRLASGEPHLVLRVDFGNDKSSSAVQLIAVGKQLPSATPTIRTGVDVVAVDLGAVELELAAGQLANSALVGQVSVGAIVEGSPLWNLVDVDHDDKLSIRERSAIDAMLTSLDENHDGSLVASEIPTRIRLGVALGGNVHLLLSRPQPPVPREPAKPRPQTPDWFASMDANGDGDLTPGEFVGTREQFAALDANGDGLLSVKEAAKAVP